MLGGQFDDLPAIAKKGRIGADDQSLHRRPQRGNRCERVRVVTISDDHDIEKPARAL